MNSKTTKFHTELGKLYITVASDENGKPCQIFGTLGKAGSFNTSVVETICRLAALAIRHEVPFSKLKNELDGLGGMQPFVNTINGESFYIRSIGDCVLKALSLGGVDE